MQGIGNDYIFVDNQNKKYFFDFALLSKTLSKRRYSIGSDGLIVILPHKNFDAEIEIFNSDGSKAKMCGNATRCVAFYLAKKLKKDNISIFCKGRVLECKVKILNQNKAIVCVNMGSVKIIKHNKNCFVAKLANKHLIVFVKNFNFDTKKVGQKLCKKFDANVMFVKILSDDKIKVKVYERGSGITLACGSGASACCFVANKFFGLNDKILAFLDGGKLLIKIGKSVQMIGECKFVYSGEIYVKNQQKLPKFAKKLHFYCNK